MFKQFLTEEDGMATLEIAIITIVLLSLALLFKDAMGNYFQKLIQKILAV